MSGKIESQQRNRRCKEELNGNLELRNIIMEMKSSLNGSLISREDMT